MLAARLRRDFPPEPRRGIFSISSSNFLLNSSVAQKIVSVANAVEHLKVQSDRIRQKSYFPYRMYKLMSTEFYIVTTVLRHQKIISPSFSNLELRDMMRSPLTFGEVVLFRHARLKKIVLYLFGVLSSSLSVYLMKMVGIIKRLL